MVLADPLRNTFPLMHVGVEIHIVAAGVTAGWPIFSPRTGLLPSLAAERWAFEEVSILIG